MLYSKAKDRIYLRLTPDSRDILNEETAEINGEAAVAEGGTEDKAWGTKDERVRRNLNKNGSGCVRCVEALLVKCCRIRLCPGYRSSFREERTMLGRQLMYL